MQSNFNTLMHDLVFKESFANEHNRRPLESLLENLLELPKGSLHNKLTVAYESQIGKSNVNEKASRTDIVVDYDDVVMDLEAYTYLHDESIDKSTFYVMKLSASRLIRGMEYEDLKVVQYNFVDNVNVNIGPDIVNEFRLVHSKYPEIRIAEDKLNINYIRIDKVRELGYNENELMKWLRFIAARSYEEREAIAEWDEMFMEFNEWIDNYVNDDVTKEALAKWNKEIEENKNVKIAREQGIEIGKEQGIEQRNVEIASNLLKMNMSIKDIIRATGLTKEEIEILKENN